MAAIRTGLEGRGWLPEEVKPIRFRGGLVYRFRTVSGEIMTNGGRFRGTRLVNGAEVGECIHFGGVYPLWGSSSTLGGVYPA